MPNGSPFFCTASGILLKRGLVDWGRLPESERQPGAVTVPQPIADAARMKIHRLTKPPSGGLILRTYIRGLKLDKDGRLFAPKIIDWEYKIKLQAEPNRDFLWLQRSEWTSLMPNNPAKGLSFAVPAAVRDRVCHWHIAGGYHGLPGYYTAEHFRCKEMTVTVENVTPQAVALRLEGSAAMKAGASYRFHGALSYDAQKMTFTRIDIIALCDEGADPKPSPQNVAPYRHYAIAFELSSERTDDLLPPFYLREHVGSPQAYFANRAR
jgi:hypothetical protein